MPSRHIVTALGAIAAFALFFGASCTQKADCRPGTFFVHASYPTSTQTLQVLVSVDGAERQSIAIDAGGTNGSGSFELDFHAYPTGATVTVSVDAIDDPGTIATISKDVDAVMSCETVNLVLVPSKQGTDGPDIDDGPPPQPVDAGEPKDADVDDMLPPAADMLPPADIATP